MVAVDVIVLSRDRPDLFAACLDAVEAQEIDYHGILVNNGSDQITSGYAHDHGWTVIEPGRNTGFSEGNNLGFQHGRGERILLLNNDAILRSGALAAMLGHEDGVVGCLNVNDAGIVNHAGGSFFRGCCPRHEGRDTQIGTWACHSCDWVTFAVALLRRDMIDEIGPMDERYWYSFEDVDYCLTAQRAGWNISVCGDAVALHPGKATRDEADDGPSRELFYEKWPAGVVRGVRA